MGYCEYAEISFDGLKRFGREWRPDNVSPKAAVCLIHGLGEHSGRYTELAEVLTNEGIALISFDLRGHGRSEGKRGHAPSLEALLRDIDQVLKFTAQRYPKLPLFLYGHSLGGGLVLNYVLQRRPVLAGVISTAPWLSLAIEPPALLMNFSKWMNRVYPVFSSPNQLDPNALSRDPGVVRSYLSDPLVHNRITVRMFISCIDAGEWTMQHASECQVPVLLMHGTADRITSLGASQQFAEQNHQTCTFRMWKGYYHEIHNEPQHEEVLSYLTSWMGMHLHLEQKASYPTQT